MSGKGGNSRGNRGGHKVTYTIEAGNVVVEHSGRQKINRGTFPTYENAVTRILTLYNNNRLHEARFISWTPEDGPSIAPAKPPEES